MTTTMMSPSYKYNDQGKLNRLTKLAAEHIDEIYSYFGIEYSYKSDILIKSECFIHGGDNDTALNVYYNGDIRVHYKCRTHQCEEHFGSSLISLIRGIISRYKYKWKINGDKEASFNEAVEFLLKFTSRDFGSLETEKTGDLEKMRFCGIVNGLDNEDVRHLGISRQFYRDTVEMPSQYYLQRGYSIEVLDKYDVGTCKRRGKSLYQRAVVPIYDNEGQHIVGFTGRSIFDPCPSCKNYHAPKDKCGFFPKWKHTAGFKKENCLYNYWYAQDDILTTGVIVLVESPGNVWRLEEAGIHNSVGIFGTHLNQNQKKIIDESGALSIVCLLDNDEAGFKGAEKIKEMCGKMYRLYFPTLETNDVGDMHIDKVTSDIGPLISQIQGVYK